MRLLKIVLCALTLSLQACTAFSTPHHEEILPLVYRDNVAERLQLRGFIYGAPVYLRIFKQERILELWMRQKSGYYQLYQRYPICKYSGDLGPKLRQGDRQAPEGFYTISKRQLKPKSRYFRALDLGYPNAYDRAKRRSGSLLMIHGDCVSAGCYAMTDVQIDEIYTLVWAALAGGQDSVPVHIFPFRMDDASLQAWQGHHWYDFWQSLQPAYRAFERYHLPPRVSVQGGEYSIEIQHDPYEHP